MDEGGDTCQVMRVTKSGRAGKGRVHEHLNIENSSGDQSAVDDWHLQKPSTPKHGAAAKLSVRRPESITQKDHTVIMRALCTQLLKPSRQSLNRPSRPVLFHQNFSFATAAWANPVPLPRSYCVDCGFVHFPCAAFPK